MTTSGPEATMTDMNVTYDCITNYVPAFQYRSKALYGADEKAVFAARPGTAVHVIKEHGDATWTPATLVRWEPIPNTDMGMIRFVVIIDDVEYRISADRIRLAG